jgi:uncharacterized protein (DUF2062 family)
MAKLKRGGQVLTGLVGLGVVARLEPVLLALVVGAILLAAAFVAIFAVAVLRHDGSAARRLVRVIDALRR